MVGRGLFTASKFPKLINHETLKLLLKVTASTVADSSDPIIKLSAMKSIYCFCEELSNENEHSIINLSFFIFVYRIDFYLFKGILVPHLQQITEGLIQIIIQNATNQIGFLTMETLLKVLSVDEQFVGNIETKISPFLIALFIKNTSDPLINSIITDTIKVVISNPYTNEKIEERIVPTLTSILNTTMETKNEHKDLSTLLMVSFLI